MQKIVYYSPAKHKPCASCSIIWAGSHHYPSAFVCSRRQNISPLEAKTADGLCELPSISDVTLSSKKLYSIHGTQAIWPTEQKLDVCSQSSSGDGEVWPSSSIHSLWVSSTTNLVEKCPLMSMEIVQPKCLTTRSFSSVFRQLKYDLIPAGTDNLLIQTRVKQFLHIAIFLASCISPSSFQLSRP
jgi:hypothetical protein